MGDLRRYRERETVRAALAADGAQTAGDLARGCGMEIYWAVAALRELLRSGAVERVMGDDQRERWRLTVSGQARACYLRALMAWDGRDEGLTCEQVVELTGLSSPYAQQSLWCLQTDGLIAAVGVTGEPRWCLTERGRRVLSHLRGVIPGLIEDPSATATRRHDAAPSGAGTSARPGLIAPSATAQGELI